MSLDGACVSIADTILEFANVVIGQMPEPQALETLRQTIELAISVWNAHTLATPVWNQPEHLNELSRLIALSASPQILAAFEALRSAKLSRFAADARVVCEWQVVADEHGRARFDCSARLPPAPSVISGRA
jgi:hypothetical protein